MRRLPVYFVIDVSESMVGDPIDLVQEGMGKIISELRTDPYALETVYISIIVFAGKALKITPLIELYNYYPPKLPIGGGTSLGNVFNFLIDELDSSLRKTTAEIKGDWKPIIFLFSDGNPTDNYITSLDNWTQKYKSKTNLIVISLGDNTDLSIFNKVTNQVFLLKNTDQESYKKFFKWVTASIKTNSLSINESNNDELVLPKLDDGFLSRFDLEKSNNIKHDENFAVILAKCQTTKKYYLIKYQKRLSLSEFSEFAQNTLDFKLVGTYAIDSTYFDLCDTVKPQILISTSDLFGFPSCPCCSNQFGLSQCSCEGIMCIGDEGLNKCPWCGSESTFSFADTGFNINRTKG